MRERAQTSHLASFGAVVVIATLSIFPGLGRATFWEPDEARFAEATRQMFERGDFLTPYLNGVPRFEKPPLMYWLQSVAFTPLGPTELSARLPAAIAGVGCVGLLYWLALSLVSRRAALLAAVVFATMFRFVVFARQGLTDVPALFFILAALTGFVRVAEAEARPRAIWLAWIAVGLGVLAKGPVGLLPLAIWAAWAMARRDWRLITGVRPLAGLAVAAAVFAPWYLAMSIMHGRAFIDFAIGHEMVSRVLSESSFAPVRGFSYYWQIWPGDAAPWSLLFVAAVIWAGYRWRTIAPNARKAMGFALAWFVCVFLIFSFSQSKIPHYILPAYPAAALLVGIFLDRMADKPEDAAWWRVPMCVVAVGCVALALVLLRSMPVLMAQAPTTTRQLMPMLLVGGGLAIAIAVWRRSAVGAACSLALALSIVFAVIGSVIVPTAIEPFKPMPKLAREAARLTDSGEPIGLLGMYGAASVIYYSQHRIQHLENDDIAVSFLTRAPHAVCLMPASDFESLKPRLPSSIRVVASGEEFNVRLSRLIERKTTPGRRWVLISRQE